MYFDLMTGSALHCNVIQPNVRDMKASEDTIWSRLPGDAQQYGLALEGFLPSAGHALSNQVSDLEAFAAAPDSRAGIKGQFSSLDFRRPLAFNSRLAMIMPSLFFISTSLSFQTMPSFRQ